MCDELIEIIYDCIKDKNLYNYSNDKDLKNVDISIYENILNEKVIDIKVNNDTYTITCTKTYSEGLDD